MKARLLAIPFILALPLALTFAQSSGEEYVVVLRGGLSIAALNKAHGTQTVRQIRGTPIYLVKAANTNTNRSILKNLKENRGVELAENNNRSRLTNGDNAPFDPSLVQQMTSLLDGSTLTSFYGSTVLRGYVEQP